MPIAHRKLHYSPAVASAVVGSSARGASSRGSSSSSSSSCSSASSSGSSNTSSSNFNSTVVAAAVHIATALVVVITLRVVLALRCLTCTGLHCESTAPAATLSVLLHALHCPTAYVVMLTSVGPGSAKLQMLPAFLKLSLTWLQLSLQRPLMCQQYAACDVVVVKIRGCQRAVMCSDGESTIDNE
jgi:hypothetical protein